MSTSDPIRDDSAHLAMRYFAVVKAGLRNDMQRAAEWFNVPDTQLRYLLQDVLRVQLDVLASFGLPFRFAHQSRGLGSSVKHILAGPRPADVDNLQGWERNAFDLACDTWWVMRDWANRDHALAALHCGLRTRAEAAELASLRAADVRSLAERTYRSMHLLDTVCMQIAYPLCEADASPDRIAVLRGSVPLSHAA